MAVWSAFHSLRDKKIELNRRDEPSWRRVYSSFDAFETLLKWSSIWLWLKQIFVVHWSHGSIYPPNHFNSFVIHRITWSLCSIHWAIFSLRLLIFSPLETWLRPNIYLDWFSNQSEHNLSWNCSHNVKQLYSKRFAFLFLFANFHMIAMLLQSATTQTIFVWSLLRCVRF